MAYTNIWNENKLTGGESANTLATLINAVRVDLQDRLQDIFAIPDFTVDPLRPYGLKFTDAQDSIINLGDNGGPSRSLIVKDKAGANTYLTINSVNIIASTLTLIKYANPEFRLAGSAINQNLIQTFYDNGATEKGHIIYAGANSVSNRYFGIFSDAADFLLIATLNNVAIQAWTNSTLAMTIGTNQAVTLANGLTINGATGLTINGSGQTTIQPTIAAGAYGVAILGAASAARDILAVGQVGVTNGFTVQWNGSNMVYTFQGGGVTISLGGLNVAAGNIIAGAGVSFTTSQSTLLLIGGATDTQLKNAANNAINLTITDAGILTLKGAITTGASAGDIVVPNLSTFRGINAAGTTALALLSVDASNQTNINLNSAKLALVNAVISSTASVGPNTLPAGCAGYLTIVMSGNTNKIPFYAN